MIVYEREDDFVMTKQHDHALLSGEIAADWDSKWFLAPSERKSVEYGIKQHDRGWIGLDDIPFWNDKHHAPYSFMDFPLLPKLTFYKKGIDEVQEEDVYAALLCSMHYISFFNGVKNKHAIEFVKEEKKRQSWIKSNLQINSLKEDFLTFHFQLLQFCDDLSLYICFQEPGVGKKDELTWYKDGFPQSFFFLKNNERIKATWLNESKIRLDPFPLQQEITVSVPLRVVPKEKIKEMGIAAAFSQTPIQTRTVLLSASEQ
ncbi:DUF3891 family protein [Pseudalkalibacillus caeni]|uniref:DUF3891 family protein n=1 Tax=Exobacillus caeni TaxID=2574798 RepID=A0A5R9FBH9_9BACL|nr:DUF3891 family protein [Pseudalkalibacillus caeni]TLS37894.1 DUF3891 family protein [Pseudalkalibacillus caeni]